MNNQPDHEALRVDAIQRLGEHFAEPSQIAWSTEGKTKLGQLYELAIKHDPNDPVGWATDFDRTCPRNLDLGEKKGTRLDKIMLMIDLMVTKNPPTAKGVNQVMREFGQ